LGGFTLFLAFILSISFYHGLTTEKFVNPAGQLVPFDYEGYVQTLGKAGVKRTRVFADLPWYWRFDGGRNGVPVFNGRLVDLPYLYLPGAKTWDFRSTNPDFAQRIRDGGAIAKTYGMDILLCFATKGPNFDCPYFSEMGYPNRDAYYLNADHSTYRNSGAWTRFLNHFKAIAKMTKGNPRQYRYFEPYNEHDSLDAKEELTAIRNAVATHRDSYRLQFNVPNPLYPVSGFSSTNQYLSWLRALLHKNAAGVKIHRLSFHGIFTADGVKRLAALLRGAGISPASCEISTDAATPWKGRFTENSRQGQYQARRHWTQNSTTIQAVITAHKEIVIAAKREGFAVCDLQDPIKWTGDLDYTRPEIKKFYEQMVAATQ
jgi:hypothetical protein